MTCAEILAKIVSLRSAILSDEGDLKELQSEAAKINKTLLQKAEQRLQNDKKQLASLLAAREPCFVKQPQDILQIQFNNPEPPADFSATVIAGGTFPSLSEGQEWVPVLGPKEEDYEGPNMVGATGWALNPDFSGADLPFTHPFGFDWEFSIALDQPAADPTKYTFLLARGNQSAAAEGADEDIQQAKKLNIPLPVGPDGKPSILGVEIDRELVPNKFSDPDIGLVKGDRVAVFGRWIVDAGHEVTVSDVASYRAEIHPPLLVAYARVTTGSLLNPASINTPVLTRVVVTSRPYLVSQRFTTDKGTIFDDSGQDDGNFVDHMVTEVRKVNEVVPGVGIPLGSVQLEAHPKIKSYPFQGSNEILLVVKPPPSNSRGPAGHLQVSYQFTARSGCAVRVTSIGSDSIGISITLNQDGFIRSPPLTRNDQSWSWDELSNLNADAGTAIHWGVAISAVIQLLIGGVINLLTVTGILERGIVTDRYQTDFATVDILDASRAISAFADNLPTGAAAVQNDNQPFPVYGWLEARYTPFVAQPGAKA